MERKHLLVTLLSATLLIAVAFGLSFFSSDTSGLPYESAGNDAPGNFGITYLNVTAGLADYYGLGIDHGDMVISVSPGGLAARAGMKSGDIILSLNGTPAEPDNPLLGMMINCPAGSVMTLEVWRQGTIDTVSMYQSAAQD